MGNEIGIEGLADPIEIGSVVSPPCTARDEVFGRRVAVKVLQTADADALRDPTDRGDDAEFDLG